MMIGSVATDMKSDSEEERNPPLDIPAADEPLLPQLHPLSSSCPLRPLVLPALPLTSLNRSDPNLPSCVSSANVTPLPTKKFSQTTDSDCGTDLLPVCRICQLPGDKEDFLFSPCRCSGTMLYVHYRCLLRWIEVSSRKTKKPPKCELCHYQYIRHKRFKFHDWRLPQVSTRDKCLHTIFLINVLIMIGCAVATVLCFLSDKGQLEQISKVAGSDTEVELSLEEIITLTCGVMFFVSFFVAMTVEIKARHTIYRLFLKFRMHNTEWQIDPFPRENDDKEVPVQGSSWYV